MRDVPLPTAPSDPGTESVRAAAWESDRASYRTVCGETEVALLTTVHATTVAEVDATRAAIQRLTAEVQTTSETFEAIDRRSGRSLELAVRLLAEEYDRMARHPDVAGISVTPEAIVVTTIDLIVAIGADRWDIGPYRVFLPRKGGVGYVKIESVRGNWMPNTYGGGASHPHVFHSGICWGNVKGPVDRALQQFEFDIAFHYILLMLKTPLPEGDAPTAGPYRGILEQIGRKIT